MSSILISKQLFTTSSAETVHLTIGYLKTNLVKTELNLPNTIGSFSRLFVSVNGFIISWGLKAKCYLDSS